MSDSVDHSAQLVDACVVVACDHSLTNPAFLELNDGVDVHLEFEAIEFVDIFTEDDVLDKVIESDDHSSEIVGDFDHLTRCVAE